MKNYFFTIFYLLLLFSTKSQDFIFHMEPPNWWVGMNSNAFQLMVHGDDISKCNVYVEDSRVVLKKINKVDNVRYLFLDFEIIDNENAFDFDIFFTKEGQVFEKYRYSLLQKSLKKKSDVSSSDVIYLIHPDRFVNGDSSNDVDKTKKDKKINRRKPNKRHGGDIQGIIDHLDYVKEMGYTSIATTSVFESNTEKLSYSGNRITDLYKIDSRLGTNNLYRDLSITANNIGLKVIKELVYNHVSDSHWWVNDPPCEDWFNNYIPNTYNRESIMDLYSFKSDVNSFENGWIDKSLPDLNQKNIYLSNYLIQNSIWWIEYAGLNGFIIDSYSLINRKFVKKWNYIIQKEYPGFFVVGNEPSYDKSFLGLLQKQLISKSKKTTLFKTPSLIDYPLENAIHSSLNKQENLKELYYNISKDYLYPNPNNMVVILDNQDLSRAFCKLKHDINSWKMAQVFLLTSRGIPQIYYGTEALLSDTSMPGNKGVISNDFPGGWDHDKKNAFNYKLSTVEKDAQDFIKTILNWRKNCPTIHDGELKHISPTLNKNLYSLVRYDDNRIVVLIINKDQEKKKIKPIDVINKLGFKISNYSALDVIDNKEVNVKNEFSINSNSCLLLDLYY